MSVAELELLNNYNALDKMKVLSDDIGAHILDNLNPNLTPRPYQIKALSRFKYYFDHPEIANQPAHLLFAMATGSGKTLIMAANILHLYKMGYRNFIFFVNSTNIILKTKENFTNPHSSKYLFNDPIHFDGENIRIKSVENFEGVNPNDINIHFTTIQGLHTRMTKPKENALTVEDFKEMEVVLLSDEAHHMNVDTKRAQGKKLGAGEQEALISWETTVQNILNANKKNIMLEFTATPDLEEPAIREKYKDKLIYDYSLKQFCIDKYSKDVQILQSDKEPMERALQAVVLSQYRQKVFADNGLIIKPVVMFKANAVNAPKKPDENKIVSSEFRESFDAMISGLTAKKLQALKDSLSGEETILKTAFDYFDNNGLSLDSLALQLQDAFSHDKCVSIDSSTNKSIDENDQILINTLEDKDNPVRGVFAVEALNEGWDVLNLFDIVRLYNTRDAKSNKAGKTTISEAQLIGRGARYCPFKVDDTQTKDQRKYDGDLTHPLRICEELYYHSAQNSKYIQELNNALDIVGIKPKEQVTKDLFLKPEFKQTDFYKNEWIFVNTQIKNENREIKAISESIRKKAYYFTLTSGQSSQSDILDGEKTTKQPEIIENTVKLSDIDPAIIRKALRLVPFMKFSNLKKYYPNLESISDFITSPDYLNNISVTFKGAKYALENISREQYLKVCISTLKQIGELIEKGHVDKKGSEKFIPKPVKDTFKDKKMNVHRKDDGTDETGWGMLESKNAELVMNLAEHDWYAFNECYGSSEEKRLIKFIASTVGKLKKSHEEVYLLRNEGHFKIYNFDDGQAFEPDFVLFLKNKNGSNERYQLFIEPKGGHLKETDKWKENFLKAIKERGDVQQINSTVEYILYGLPFYNYSEQSEFAEEFEKITA